MSVEAGDGNHPEDTSAEEVGGLDATGRSPENETTYVELNRRVADAESALAAMGYYVISKQTIKADEGGGDSDYVAIFCASAGKDGFGLNITTEGAVSIYSSRLTRMADHSYPKEAIDAIQYFADSTAIDLDNVTLWDSNLNKINSGELTISASDEPISPPTNYPRNSDGKLVNPRTNEPIRYGSPEHKDALRRNILPLDQFK